MVLTVAEDNMVQAVVAATRRKKKEEEENLQGERTGGCYGWSVAVLASCGKDGG